MNVAMPEFDGRIITVPVFFKKWSSGYERLGTAIQRYVRMRSAPRAWRVSRATGRACATFPTVRSGSPSFSRTTHQKRSDRQRRRPGYTGLGPRLLRRLESVGYNIGILPEDGDQLIHRIIDEGSYDTSDLTGEQMRATAGQLSERQYNAWLTGPARGSGAFT